jgi:hypothetical protein
MKSWTKFAALAILAGLVTGASAAPAPAPVTTEQFVARCKTDARFCKTQIQAAQTVLERRRKACLAAGLTKDAMATRVQDTIADVLEEDPDTFRNQSYRQVVDQIILYLWPCEPIS